MLEAVSDSPGAQAGGEIGWARVEQLALDLNERVRSLLEHQNRTAILEPEAEAAALAIRPMLIRVLEAPGAAEPELYVLDMGALSTVAAYHYLHCELLGPTAPGFEAEARLTLNLYAVIHLFAPDEVPLELRQAVAAAEMPPVHDFEALASRFDELYLRWRSGGDRDTLESVIGMCRTVLQVLPSTHPARPALLSSLCGALRDHHTYSGVTEQLEEAVAAGREALDLARPEDPMLPAYLSGLCSALYTRYLMRGSAADLDEAVEFGQRSVRAAPEPDPGFGYNAGNALLLRFDHSADPGDLDLAVEVLQRSVPDSADGGPLDAACRTALAEAHRKRFQHYGDAFDLAEAERSARAAVEGCAPGNPELPRCLIDLSAVLRTKAEGSGEDADHDAAVAAAERALAVSLPTGPQHQACLSNLGNALAHRFKHAREPAEIDRAIALLRQAIDEAGESHFASMSRFELAQALLNKYRGTGDRGDLDAAVGEARTVLDAYAEAGSDRGMALGLLGEGLNALAGDFNVDVGEEAVAVLREARALLDGFHRRSRLKCANELGNALYHRAARTHSLEDLDAAIAAHRESIALNASGEDLAREESSLGGSFLRRFVLSDDTDDLDRALEWHRRAERSLNGDADPHAHQVYFNLAQTLHAAHDRYQDPALMEESLRYFDKAGAVENVTAGDRAKSLTNRGMALRIRAEGSGNRDDLDRAVEWSREALDSLPAGHADRVAYSTNLANALMARYTRTGDADDLEAAVRTHREAVAATPADDLRRPMHLANLGSAVRLRFSQSGSPADLDEAITCAREAIRHPRATREGLIRYRNNLTIALVTRFERTGEAADVDAAVEAARAAADSVRPGHARRMVFQSTLATALRHRFSSPHRRPGDVDEAITALREAIRVCPEDHPSLPIYHMNLSIALTARFHEAGGRRKDVKEAATAGRTAVRLFPQEHPERARALMNLGSVLVAGMRWWSSAPLDEAFDCFRQALELPAATTMLRFRITSIWRRTARQLAVAGVRGWDQALEASRAAIGELPRLAWHGLEHDDRVLALGQNAGIASEAAAIALNAGRPEEALQLLEQGRGILLAHALDARDDMAELRERDPDLAERITRVRARIETVSVPTMDFMAGDLGGEGGALGAAGTGVDALAQHQRMEVDRRRELARELDDLVSRARGLPGLEDFQRPPSLTRLRASAADGPVIVVNTSDLRCDAFIVTGGRISTVPLPDLRVDDGPKGEKGLRTRTAELLDALAAHGEGPAATWRAQLTLKDTLVWLWDAVAEPVLTELERLSLGPDGTDSPSRLWWCPTGLLSLLPLHAAGRYDDSPAPERAQSRPGRNRAIGTGPRTLPDRYVCSYTTTLRSLAALDGGHRARPAGGILVVDQSEVPGLAPLPHARAEAHMLTERLPGATLLKGSEASRAAILQALLEHPMLHFSGHGRQDWNDAAGGVLYCGERGESETLTVTDISRLRLGDARLAFLSACETARGTAEVPDEALHLSGALQLAGFAHVVAAQWTVDDEFARRLTEEFYEELRPSDTGDLAPDEAARALHRAVQRLRSEADDPIRWAAYIHTGP